VCEETNVREPDVEITTPIIEFSAPLELEIEVVNEDLTAPTHVGEETNVRELAGPDVEITAPIISSLHSLGLRLRL